MYHPLGIHFGKDDTVNVGIRRLGTRWHWKRSYAYEFLVEQMPNLDRREINRMLSAYVGPEEASVDLVFAVSTDYTPNSLVLMRDRLCVISASWIP